MVGAVSFPVVLARGRAGSGHGSNHGHVEVVVCDLIGLCERSVVPWRAMGPVQVMMRQSQNQKYLSSRAGGAPI